MYSKQKSLNFGQYVPNDKVLNKRIPENPKYKHVKPAIDTGKNVRKHIDELKEKQKNCNHKKDEVFKRIKLSTFIKLVIAVATDLLSNENNADSSPEKPKTAEPLERRGVANVLMGIGELDLVHEKKKVHSAPVKSRKQMPYLLLDVRDRDAFSQCHIITAKSYPSAMLSRSIGYEIEDLKSFKNCPHSLIILYDDDEITAARVATTLVERGYDNIYLLSGGLKVALEICPHGLTTSSQSFHPVHLLTQGATSNPQKCSSKEYFSQEDIETVQGYIDAYPTRSKNPAWSSQYSQSRRDKSSTSSQRRSANANRSIPSRASSTSRRPSACSSLSFEQMHLPSAASTRNSRPLHTRSSCSKSTEQIHTKPTIEEKSRTLKKAPWK